MKFKTEDVLGLYSGRLLGNIGGIYEAANYLSGQTVFTHMIPKVHDRVKPILERRFPELAEVDFSDVTPSNVSEKLASYREKFGDEMDLKGLEGCIEKVSFAEGLNPEKVIVVVAPEENLRN